MAVDVCLAANVAHLRQGEEWSQAQLARAVRHHGLAWTRATVAQVETGGRALSAKEVLVLAAVFGTALATLYESDAPVVMVGDAPWSAPWYAAVLVGAYDSVPAKLRPRSSEGWDYVARVQHAVENTMVGRKTLGRAGESKTYRTPPLTRCSSPTVTLRSRRRGGSATAQRHWWARMMWPRRA